MVPILPLDPVQALQTSPARNAAFSAVLERYLQRTNYSGSVLVAIGDEIIHSGGYGVSAYRSTELNRPDSIYLTASITKIFTAVAIMQLRERGLLLLNDSIAKHLGSAYSNYSITLQQLLSHTSGLLPIEETPVIWMAYALDHRHLEAVHSLLESGTNLMLRGSPGERFEYNNLNYLILGAVIETVSGLSYEEYLNTHIFDPAGLKDSGYIVNHAVLENFSWPAGSAVDDNWYHVYQAAAGVHSTVFDLFRFSRAFQSDILISRESRAEMLTAWTEAYGLGLVLEERAYGHDGKLPGGYATLWYVDPYHDITIILLGNSLRTNPRVVLEVVLSELDRY